MREAAGQAGGHYIALLVEDIFEAHGTVDVEAETIGVHVPD